MQVACAVSTAGERGAAACSRHAGGMQVEGGAVGRGVQRVGLIAGSKASQRQQEVHTPGQKKTLLDPPKLPKKYQRTLVDFFGREASKTPAQTSRLTYKMYDE